MGTNYYHESERCDHCGRNDGTRHIGKASAGWQFSFRAYPYDNIVSWEDWKRELLAGGTIKNEYGATITFDEFEELALERDGLMNHYDYLASKYPGSLAGRDWKDDEGFSFSASEFT